MKAQYVFEKLDFKRGSNDNEIKEKMFGLRPGTLISEPAIYPRVYMVIQDNGLNDSIYCQVGFFKRTSLGKYFQFQVFNRKESIRNATLKFFIKIKPKDFERLIVRYDTRKKVYRDYDPFRDIEKETGVKAILDKQYYE